MKRAARRFCLDKAFEAKRALREFYKSVHPDTLEAAPARVREENLRSLKTLNDYLDRVRASSGAERTRLKFYVPARANDKQKRFLPFEVRLEGFAANAENAKALEPRVAQLLGSAVAAVRLAATPVAHSPTPAAATDASAESDPLTAAPEVFAKSSEKVRRLRDLADFRARFNAEEQRQQREDLLRDITRGLRATYPRLSPADSFAQGVYAELSAHRLTADLLSAQVNPKLFFVQSGLTQRALLGFLRRLDRYCEQHLQRYLRVQSVLEAHDPRLRVLLADRFATEAGFVLIDHAAEPAAQLDFIAANLLDALEKREGALAGSDALQQLKTRIEETFDVNALQLGEGDDESLCTKRQLFLVKVEALLRQLSARQVPLRGTDIALVPASEERVQPLSLRLRWNFSAPDVLRRLDALRRPVAAEEAGAASIK